jgi:hypothetical protein
MTSLPLPDDGTSSGLERAWHGQRDRSGVPSIAPTASDLLSRLSGPARASDLLMLASIDLATLSDPYDRVAFLKAVDRLAACVAALRSDAVVTFAGAEPSLVSLAERHVTQELAVAARVSAYTAAKQIETARALEVVFPAFKDALRSGEISQSHCTVLVDRTRLVADDAALTELGRVALPKAKRMTPGQFGKECEALVIRFDRDAAARARIAVQERRVTVKALEDGMGYLGLVHDWATISSIEQVVRADGRRLQLARRAGAECPDSTEPTTTDESDGEDTTADACRADALAARLLGTVGEDGEITWDRETPQVEVQIVMDLATLRGENENPCLLDGMPITADLARDFAGYAKAFRRMVTAPVTGHLLDYGRRVYLPDTLRTFVRARDGHCTTPVCTIHAEPLMQMDHGTRFPQGPSNTTNAHLRCLTCHQLKTAGHVSIHDTRPDGSHTWRSIWGQSVHVPARAFLPGRDDPPLPLPEPAQPGGRDT